MIDSPDYVIAAIDYLHRAGVAFELVSDPLPEPLPLIARPLPHGSMRLATQVVVVNEVPTIAVYPDGEQISLMRLGEALSAIVLEGNVGDLPSPFRHAPEPAVP